MSANELVPSVSITNLVNQRAAILDKMRQAFVLIRECGELATAGHLGMPRVSMSDSRYSSGRYGSDMQIADANLHHNTRGPMHHYEKDPDEDSLKYLVRSIDAGAWQYLMHESGMRSLMDATARKKWDESISGGDFPELTADNIRATFSMLHDSRADMFERGVLACFKSLSWDYKTNLPQKFGKRIVITYINGSYGHDRCNEVDDLLRVLNILDGKPEPDHRNGFYSMLSGAGLTSYQCNRGIVENDYIHVRVFKNRSGHITFKRPELIDKMNKIIAKHYPNALPEPK